MIEVLEPATAEVMAEVPKAGVEETDAAVARAKEAFPAWRSSPGRWWSASWGPSTPA